VSGAGGGDVGRLAHRHGLPDTGAVVQIHGEARFGLVIGARDRCTAWGGRKRMGGRAGVDNADAVWVEMEMEVRSRSRGGGWFWQGFCHSTHAPAQLELIAIHPSIHPSISGVRVRCMDTW
jgi:hypothetical protein